MLAKNHPHYELHHQLVKLYNEFNPHLDEWVKDTRCRVTKIDVELLRFFVFSPNLRKAAKHIGCTVLWTDTRLDTLPELMTGNYMEFLDWLNTHTKKNTRKRKWKRN